MMEQTKKKKNKKKNKNKNKKKRRSRHRRNSKEEHLTPSNGSLKTPTFCNLLYCISVWQSMAIKGKCEY